MKKFLGNYFAKGKVIEYLDKKGFYLVLVLCLGIITLTAYSVTKRNLANYSEDVAFDNLSQKLKNTGASINNEDVTKSESKHDVSVSSINKSNISDMTKVNEKTNNRAKEATRSEKPKNNDISSSKTAEVSETPVIKTLNMMSPVLGGISRDYAADRLIYSKTLEQWTTHEGEDILADRGTPVKAAEDGIVQDVYNDYKYGITIIVSHGNGIKTKYSNLSTDSMVKKGQKVKKGDVISGVGNTAMFESGEESHLHFEVLKDDKTANPKEYIK